MHVDLFVEDASTKEALEVLINRLCSGIESFSFAIVAFDNKKQMLSEIEQRLLPIARGQWVDAVILVIDQDRDDCLDLKRQLLDAAARAGLSNVGSGKSPPQVIARIAMTELESWFLGDPDAVRLAFPRLRHSDLRVKGDVDAAQDAWERLERPLLRHGYYKQRMPKVRTARRIAEQMTITPGENRSHSFNVLLNTLHALVNQARSEA